MAQQGTVGIFLFSFLHHITHKCTALTLALITEIDWIGPKEVEENHLWGYLTADLHDLRK